MIGFKCLQPNRTSKEQNHDIFIYIRHRIALCSAHIPLEGLPLFWAWEMQTRHEPCPYKRTCSWLVREIWESKKKLLHMVTALIFLSQGPAIYILRWPWTHLELTPTCSDPPASAYWVLGLQVCSTWHSPMSKSRTSHQIPWDSLAHPHIWSILDHRR